MNMLNKNRVYHAIELAKPAIKEIFDDKKCIWGPKLVAVVVDGPGLDAPILSIVGDHEQDWDPEWGEVTDFARIAFWKAGKAREMGRPTSELVFAHPLTLMEGDFFYPGGVIDSSGTIGVGVSGIKGWADEMIAKIVVAILEGVAHLDRDVLREAGQSQL